MHVVARLPPDLLARIRLVLTPADQLIDAPDWPALLDTLHHQPVDLIILDPSAQWFASTREGEDQSASLPVLLWEFRSIPLIVYTAYTREAMRALLPLAQAGVHQVVLRGFDDARPRLRDLLDQVAARVIGERLLARVLPRLAAARAPEQIVDALTRLFRGPQSFRTVPHLAEAAGRERGMLDRWLRRARLAPAKVLIVAARVAWAYHYARSPGNRFKSLSARLGYPSALPLSRHVKWMTGMTPTMLRALTPEAVEELLLRRIVLPAEIPR